MNKMKVTNLPENWLKFRFCPFQHFNGCKSCKIFMVSISRLPIQDVYKLSTIANYCKTLILNA